MYFYTLTSVKNLLKYKFLNNILFKKLIKNKLLNNNINNKKCHLSAKFVIITSTKL